MIELQRVADFKGLPINKQPAHFPVDATHADCTIAALVDAGEDPVSYTSDLFAATWAKEKDTFDAHVLLALLTHHKFDAETILEAAKSDAIIGFREQNSKDAVEADAVGVPTYVVEGEVFWGQDRIELLDNMLVTGRAIHALKSAFKA